MEALVNKEIKELDSMKLGLFLDSLILKSGKEYNLNVVKQVKVTEDFLAMDKADIKCQNHESFDECTTRLYLDDLKSRCGCIPFHMGLTYQVLDWLIYVYVNIQW